MAKKNTPTTDAPQQTTPPEQEPQQSFRVLSQHITDLSFECPKPPLLLGAVQNNLNLEVGVKSAPIPQPQAENGTQTPTIFEVTLSLKAHNQAEGGATIYLLELQYSGLFALENISQQHIQPLLAVEAPTLLYPFARQVLTSTIAASGMQAPLLDPVNFAGLYMQQQQQKEARSA